jgi:aspartate racemase
MPCNTAHFWYDDLLVDAAVPFLHIVDAAADLLVTAGLPQGRAVGLIATKATLKAGMFQDRLRGRGYTSIVPIDADLDRWTVPGIARVKANRLGDAAALFRPAIEALLAAGADRVILACTEVPPAFPSGDALLRDSCIDATEALARATVSWALARRKGGI